MQLISTNAIDTTNARLAHLQGGFTRAKRLMHEREYTYHIREFFIARHGNQLILTNSQSNTRKTHESNTSNARRENGPQEQARNSNTTTRRRRNKREERTRRACAYIAPSTRLWAAGREAGRLARKSGTPHCGLSTDRQTRPPGQAVPQHIYNKANYYNYNY